MAYNDYSLYQATRGSPAPAPAPAVQPMNAAANIFTYPYNLQGAIDLIEQALAGETEDRDFYAWLIEHAPSGSDRQIIAGIRENEIGHYGLFRQLYSELTGRMPPPLQGEPFTPPASYCEGVRRALLGEQNAVSRYRRILYALQNRVHINMLTEIITDEIRHGILYNYLFTRNGCRD